MKKILIILLLLVFSSPGFAATKSLSLIEARGQNVDRSKWISRKNAVVLAQSELLNSKHIENFQIFAPIFEKDFSNMLNENLYFVRFKPELDQAKRSKAEFLVIIDPLYGRIEYAGLHLFPKGDPFFKYHSVMKKVRGL